MRFPFSRRVRLVSVVALVVAAAAVGAGATLAAFPDSDVATFTGCLSDASGQIGEFSPGLSPRKACGPNQEQIHLGGGDITKVTAGTGLVGGGDNGAVALGVDPAYQLPQNCSDGETPKQSSGTWTCASIDPTAWTSAGDATVGPNDAKIVTSLSLPAGTFFVLLTGGVNNNDTGNVEATCELTNNGFPVFGGFGVQTELTDVGHAVIPVSSSGITTGKDPFKVNVNCITLGSDRNDPRDVVHYSLALTAFRVGAVVAQ